MPFPSELRLAWNGIQSSPSQPRWRCHRWSRCRSFASALLLAASAVWLPCFGTEQRDETASALGAVPAHPTLQALADRIRSSPLDPSRVPDPLILGGMYGGQLTVSSPEPDPLMPQTLDVYFDYWNATVRARLLLDYAWSVATPEGVMSYTGISKKERTQQLLRDQEVRMRIKHVATQGKYRDDWAPFVSAYLEFVPVARRRLEESESTGDSITGLEGFRIVDAVAKEHRLQALALNARVAPEVIADEMIRLVVDARREAGSLELDEGEGDAPLLYWCDQAPISSEAADNRRSPEDYAVQTVRRRVVTVHVRTWHPLAPALLEALSNDGAGTSGASAQLVSAFRRIGSKFGKWIARHPDADATKADKRLLELIRAADLSRLVTVYSSSTSSGDP